MFDVRKDRCSINQSSSHPGPTKYIDILHGTSLGPGDSSLFK